MPGDRREGKATLADPRRTLGPEAVVRGWQPTLGEAGRRELVMDLQHAQDTGAGLVVEASVASRSPQSGFPSSALEVGQRNTPLLFRYLSPSPASCPR